MHTKSMGIVFKRGDVNEDEFPQNYFMEAEAGLEWVNNNNVGTTCKGQ